MLIKNSVAAGSSSAYGLRSEFHSKWIGEYGGRAQPDIGGRAVFFGRLYTRQYGFHTKM
jgi:hypothetical protein